MSQVARRPLIAGNWKMNMTHLEAIGLTQKVVFSLTEKELDAAEVVVLPPFTALRSVQTLVAGDKLPIGYGGQDLSPHDSGAYTGDVSGVMLAALACGFVVVGHSERRTIHGEDDATVNAKVKAALRHGLTPILCVGEGLAERFGAETAESVRILYGGSVKASNTAGILVGPDIDGALVGGASLDADEFAQICKIAADVS